VTARLDASNQQTQERRTNVAKKPTRKTAKSASAPPRRKKTISLKKIVADINKALAELERAKGRPTRAGAAAYKAGHKVDQARLSLMAARDAVESACVPTMDFPEF
jgi:hypothetical protein